MLAWLSGCAVCLEWLSHQAAWLVRVLLSVLGVLLWVLGVGFTLNAYAQTYSAGFGQSHWAVASNPFACSLTHQIPGYGHAQLSHKAGADEVFELHQGKVLLPPGRVVIEAVPPEWRNDLSPVDLGEVQATAGTIPVRLVAPELLKVKAQLEKGMRILLSSDTVSDLGTSMRIALEPQQFPAAYKQYQVCITQLIPYRFQQVARTVIHYPVAAEVLSAAARSQLDKVVRYGKADPKVLGIVIDAHSEKLMDPTNAEAISKLQAELVRDYLVKQGFASHKVMARWHGGKLPIASNDTASGKAKNRRITVRLETETTRRATEKKAAARKAAEEKITANQAAENQADQEASASSADQDAEPIPSLKRLMEMVEEQDLTSGKQPSVEKPGAESP